MSYRRRYSREGAGHEAEESEAFLIALHRAGKRKWTRFDDDVITANIDTAAGLEAIISALMK